jgi:hypothetical protein
MTACRYDPPAMAGKYEPARSLAETQLQIQFGVLGGLDTSALGILAVDVALATITVAAKATLGHLWWLPLAALAASGSCCFLALVTSGDRLGPTIATVLEQTIETATEDDLNKFVAEELKAAIDANGPHIQGESRIIAASVSFLFLALILGLVLAVIAN